jgi:hypothetical protein
MIVSWRLAGFYIMVLALTWYAFGLWAMVGTAIIAFVLVSA